MGAFLFGKDAMCYYSSVAKATTSDATTISWTEYDNVTDISFNFTGETVDTTTRATAKDGWDAQENVINSGEVSFTILEKSSADTTLDAVISAFLNNTLLTMQFMNGDETVSGNRGLASNFSVSMNRAEPIKGVQTWDVTLRTAQFTEWWTAP